MPGTEKPSLSDEAYELIKHSILRLEFRPGQFLNELSICKTLGIGRTPVHQAVHRLMAEGLLTIIPRKGVLITADSMNEILDVIEARWAVEPTIAALAAERASAAHIAQLANLMQEAAALADKPDRSRLMEIDHEFHGVIAAAAGNLVLADLIRPLRERSGRLWHLQRRGADDMTHTQTEHEAVLEAIRRGDKDAAARAMQVHLMSLRRRRILAEG